jgi:hypothetical protein
VQVAQASGPTTRDIDSHTPTDPDLGTLLSAHDADLEISESEDSDYDSNRKPKLPYVKGFKFSIRKHEPSEPYGHRYHSSGPLAPQL